MSSLTFGTNGNMENTMATLTEQDVGKEFLFINEVTGKAKVVTILAIDGWDVYVHDAATPNPSNIPGLDCFCTPFSKLKPIV